MYNKELVQQPNPIRINPDKPTDQADQKLQGPIQQQNISYNLVLYVFYNSVLQIWRSDQVWILTPVIFFEGGL